MTEIAQDIYSSMIALSVFNAFLCYTTIMLNSVTIHALRKTSSVPKPLKTLLLSLVVSDLGVGLLVQPLYVARLVMNIEDNTQTRSYEIMAQVYRHATDFLSFASYFGVTALSADRFLANYLHLRYQELVTHKRVVSAVISIWMFCAMLTLLFKWIPTDSISIIALSFELLCFATSALFYYKIYLAVRHHSNQIHVLEVQLAQNNGGDMANAARERKAAVATFYVYLVFLICFLPNLCCWVIYENTVGSNSLWHGRLYTFTLVLLNSSLNPLIYSWKMRHVRHAIMEILTNVLPHPHQ